MRYKQTTKKSLIFKLLIGLLAVLIVVGALYGIVKLVEDHMKGEEDQIGDSGDWGTGTEAEEHILDLDGSGYIYTDDLETFLLIGTDDTGKGKDDINDMADFLLLMVINRTQNTYGFIQIDRDTIAEVPVLDENGEEEGYYDCQICISHAYGRDDEEADRNTVNAVSKLLGNLEIDGYYAIDMNDIDSLNNAIGGVEVTIDGDLTNVDPEFKDGAKVLLKDDQAEKFVRARMETGKGTNKERMSRQLQYMQSAYNRVINQIRENPDYLNDIYSEVQDKVRTDRNAKELSEFASYIGQSETKGFLEFDGESKRGETLEDGIMHSEFYVEQDAILRTLKELIKLDKEVIE